MKIQEPFPYWENGGKRSFVRACFTYYTFYRIAQCSLQAFSFLHAGNWTFIHVLSSATLELLQATTMVMHSYLGNNEMWQR